MGGGGIGIPDIPPGGGGMGAELGGGGIATLEGGGGIGIPDMPPSGGGMGAELGGGGIAAIEGGGVFGTELGGGGIGIPDMPFGDGGVTLPGGGVFGTDLGAGERLRLGGGDVGIFGTSACEFCCILESLTSTVFPSASDLSLSIAGFLDSIWASFVDWLVSICPVSVSGTAGSGAAPNSVC